MTTQNIDWASEEIVTVLRNTGAFGQVPLNPPSIMSYSNFCIVYPFTGVFEVSPIGTKRPLHNIGIDMLSKNMDIARTIATLKPFIETVSNALLSEVTYSADGMTVGDQFNHSIETFARLTYTWMQTDYGGVPVLGYHFMMEDVKQLINL